MATSGTFYVDLAADPGGDGTTRNHTGANAAFQTLAIALAALQDTLVGDLIIRCQGGADAPVTLAGFGTAAGARLIIEADDGVGGSGVYDNDGINLGETFDVSKYHIDGNAGAWCVDSDINFDTYRDLQFRMRQTSNNRGAYTTDISLVPNEHRFERVRVIHDSANSNHKGIRANRNSANIVIQSSHIEGKPLGGTNVSGIYMQSAATCLVENTAVHGWDQNVQMRGTTVVLTMKNCTLFSADVLDVSDVDGAAGISIEGSVADQDLDAAGYGTTNGIWGDAAPYGSITAEMTAPTVSPANVKPAGNENLFNNGQAVTVTLDLIQNPYGTPDQGCFADTGAPPAGWSNDFSGTANAAIGEIDDTAKANIDNVSGVS